jgi:hypothetical protein
MYALAHAPLTLLLRGNAAAAVAHCEEFIALAEEKTAPFGRRPVRCFWLVDSPPAEKPPTQFN